MATTYHVGGGNNDYADVAAAFADAAAWPADDIILELHSDDSSNGFIGDIQSATSLLVIPVSDQRHTGLPGTGIGIADWGAGFGIRFNDDNCKIEHCEVKNPSGVSQSSDLGAIMTGGDCDVARCLIHDIVTDENGRRYAGVYSAGGSDGTVHNTCVAHLSTGGGGYVQYGMRLRTPMRCINCVIVSIENNRSSGSRSNGFGTTSGTCDLINAAIWTDYLVSNTVISDIEAGDANVTTSITEQGLEGALQFSQLITDVFNDPGNGDLRPKDTSSQIHGSVNAGTPQVAPADVNVDLVLDTRTPPWSLGGFENAPGGAPPPINLAAPTAISNWALVDPSWTAGPRPVTGPAAESTWFVPDPTIDTGAEILDPASAVSNWAAFDPTWFAERKLTIPGCISAWAVADPSFEAGNIISAIPPASLWTIDNPSWSQGGTGGPVDPVSSAWAVPDPSFGAGSPDLTPDAAVSAWVVPEPTIDTPAVPMPAPVAESLWVVPQALFLAPGSLTPQKAESFWTIADPTIGIQTAVIVPDQVPASAWSLVNPSWQPQKILTPLPPQSAWVVDTGGWTRGPASYVAPPAASSWEIPGAVFSVGVVPHGIHVEPWKTGILIG